MNACIIWNIYVYLCNIWGNISLQGKGSNINRLKLPKRILEKNKKNLVKNMTRLLPKKEDRKTFKMQCFPLYSILKAFGNLKIDFLSLDIEGMEFSVMESILKPKTEFEFNVATIEKAHMNKPESRASFIEFDYMMRGKGYRMFETLHLDALYDNFV